MGSVEEVDIAGLGNPRGNFASGSSSSAAAVSAEDSYGAPLADPVSSGSSAPAIDEYGAPAGPILTDSSSPPEAVAPIDEYGAPAAPVQDTYPAASAAEPASDSYGAPTADVLPAPSSPAGDSYGAPTADVLPAPSAPVGDSYGAPTSDVLPASSSSAVVAADSGYGAPVDAPLIQVQPNLMDKNSYSTNDFVRRTTVLLRRQWTRQQWQWATAMAPPETLHLGLSTSAPEKSFSSLHLSSYDAPAVPAGGARYNRRNWSHQLL